jgi:hypothetical protein
VSSTSTVLCTAAACRAVISECCDVQRTTTEHEASRRLKTEFLLQVGARLRCMCRCRCRTSPHAPSCTCAQLCRSDRPRRLCSIAWHDRPHQSCCARSLSPAVFISVLVIPLSSTASPQTRTSGCCWSQQRTGTYRGITSKVWRSTLWTTAPFGRLEATLPCTTESTAFSTIRTSGRSSDDGWATPTGLD